MTSLLRLVSVGALACAFSAAAVAQSYTFDYFAGLPPTRGSADGVGTLARFNTPSAVAVAANGTIYVADMENHTIRAISPAGVVTTVAGKPGDEGWADGTGSTARFRGPTGVAVDAAGNVFVADYGNHVIRRITPGGVVTTFAGEPMAAGSADGTGITARFNSPWGIAISPDGSIFVTDRVNSTIRKITPAGVVSTFAGRAGSPGPTDGAGTLARFGGPTGIAVDQNGTLYVTDDVAHTVRRITAAGIVSTLAGAVLDSGSNNGTGAAAQFYAPRGIAVDAAGMVYVADTYNSMIRKIDASGGTTTWIGQPGLFGNSSGTGPQARLFWPMGVAVDPSGNLLIADSVNHTIRKATSAAVVSVLAGGGGNIGSASGKGADATFYVPQSVAIARDGAVLVVESGNSVIRRISPDGVATIFAGSPRTFDNVDGVGTAARFYYPFGIAVAPDGTAYVSDNYLNIVKKITPDGAVSHFVGVASSTGGSTDGPRNTARFYGPGALAVHSDGTIYVADRKNHTIRKVTPEGVTSTLAGTAGSPGSADGVGPAARFVAPGGLAVAPDGTVYVSDSGNYLIRKIAPDGTVSTVAGTAGQRGDADGLGADARFRYPLELALDAAGNLFVADADNFAIRMITPERHVTTIGGNRAQRAMGAGTASNAHFMGPSGLALAPDGTLYISDTFGNVVMRGVRDQVPTVIAAPQSLALRAGADATLSVTARGGGLSYQWRKDGQAIAGATSANHTISDVDAATAGKYSVEVKNSAGSIVSSVATVSLSQSTNLGHIANLSIRSRASSDADALFVGFGIGGDGTTGNKPLLIRGAGPTLTAFSVPGALADPMLEIIGSAGTIAANDDWAGNAQVVEVGERLQAFPFSSTTSADAAVYRPAIATGTYSAKISGKAGAAGVTLAEIYDATTGDFTPTTPRLINVSARTHAGSGGDVLTAGFVILGDTAKNVLIRAIGPTLANWGLTGVLADPKLTLFHGGRSIAENDDWSGTASLEAAFGATGAFGLSKSSKDAALVVTLAPGLYTAQVSGIDSTTGLALVEVYELP